MVCDARSDIIVASHLTVRNTSLPGVITGSLACDLRIVKLVYEHGEFVCCGMVLGQTLFWKYSFPPKIDEQRQYDGILKQAEDHQCSTRAV